MKIAAVIFALSLALSAPIFANAKTNYITGMRAKALIDIGNKLNVTYGGMGRVDFDLNDITCKKIVDDTRGEVTCLIAHSASGSKDNIALTTEDKSQKGIASDLRLFLSELTGADKKVSITEKLLRVKSVNCHASGYGHNFDQVELEVIHTCKIEIQ